jgi:hypothetical protein
MMNVLEGSGIRGVAIAIESAVSRESMLMKLENQEQLLDVMNGYCYN